jgi:hypothetical protein
MNNTTHFYRDLPVIPSFSEATEGNSHAYLPRDWWVVIADIAGSTQAIETGNYKKVNTVGVACIAAVVNVDRSIDLPFIFGGDGATFAIPDALREDAIKALRAAQQLARVSFGLELRVGLVRVAELVTENYWLRIGKVQLSQYVTQPVLSGRGWEEAERRVKDTNASGVLRVVESEGVAEGSFEGFECRWQNVPSFQDHKLALLVAATSKDAATNFMTYQNVLAKIQAIYGDVEDYHPLRVDRMRLTFSPKLLSHEWRVRSAHLIVWQRIQYFAKMLFMNAAGRYIFAKKIDTEAVKWTHYLDDLVDNSDFRKFDGMLRMVIDGKNAQAAALEKYLENEYHLGRLVYGMHQSPEALMTCIVQSYNGNHLHFVDGSDGGYALAAHQLKQQLKAALAHKGSGNALE